MTAFDPDFRATVEAMLGKPIQDWQWRIMEHLLGGNAEESESQVAPGLLASEERLASSASPKSPGALCSPTYDRQPFDEDPNEIWEYGHEGHGYWGAR